MQKFFNITVGLAIVALAILLFLLWRSVNKKLEDLTALIPPVPVPAPVDTTGGRNAINANQWFEELKRSAENMTIQMEFK